MSLFSQIECVCPSCGVLHQTEIVASVNADRRPDLREDILAARFQACRCVVCGASWRLPPNLTYMDLARDQWILAEPADGVARWPNAEERTLAVFAAGYGSAAPDAAREIGATLRVRLVFGWPALREKLLAVELGVEDVSLELLKIAVLRNVANSPYPDRCELRLDGGDKDTIRLVWMDSATETRFSGLKVPRATYDDIAADIAWDEMRADLTRGPFVDLARLLVEAQRPA